MSIASAPPKRLPTPVERPQADVVIYDGHCRFCRGQVERLARWDGQSRLAFLSLHDAEVARRWPELTYDELMQNMVVMDHDGGKHSGAEAIRYLTRRVRRLWWLAPLLSIPGSMPLWKWLYRQVANRRYLFGKLETCDEGSCSLHR